VSDLKKRINCK